MYSLFLLPVNNDSATTAECLWRTMAESGIIDAPDSLPVAGSGPRLMEFINYLGCSPVANQLEPNSQIKLHDFKRVTGLGGESFEKMRYSCCKQPVKDGSALLSQLTDYPSVKCPNCDATIDSHRINFRKTAGFARLFVEITNIFPKEALPNDRLLKLLSPLTGCEWNWFYSKSTL